jgi:hypothetical protein
MENSTGDLAIGLLRNHRKRRKMVNPRRNRVFSREAA